MADQLESLRSLQTVDTQLYRVRREQQQKPLELERAKQLVAEQRAKAQTMDERVKALQMAQKDQELELSTRETQIKKLQGQLFQVKTNKEYTAMQHEIEQAKADVSLLEETILGMLDEVEEAKRMHHAEVALLEQSEAALRREEDRVGRELAALEEQLNALTQQRQQLAPSVPREALTLYERVLVNREGLALVPLLGDSCGGCHMVQPPQVVSEVQLKTKLVTCETCNRILYLNDTTA